MHAIRAAVVCRLAGNLSDTQRVMQTDYFALDADACACRPCINSTLHTATSVTMSEMARERLDMGRPAGQCELICTSMIC